MAAIESGGQAFPAEQHYGMTLRDWYAGQALAGLAAMPHLQNHNQAIARMAFELADAMITNRQVCMPFYTGYEAPGYRHGL